MKLEHKAGPDIIHELAVNVYPSSLECFREAIANALDEQSSKVDLRVSLKEVTVEDWGQGIKDIESFRQFGQYGKMLRGAETIGRKGLGKLSLLRLGPDVTFDTNNGDIGIHLVMTPEYIDVQHGAAQRILSHQGTRIMISNPKDVPPIDELSHYLRKTFGLRIAKGTQILLNGTEVKPSISDTAEHFLFRLPGAVDITGNLKFDEKKGRGVVDVYVKHVFVQQLIVDPERLFSGWVNCNDLEPTTARNELLKDKLYSEFLKHLREYVASRFPKREDHLGREEILLGNQLAKLLKDVLKDLSMFPEGTIPLGKGTELDGQLGEKGKKKRKQQKPKIAEEVVPEYVKLHVSRKSPKPIRRQMQTDYGINWLDQDYGNEKEPLFFVEPNLCIKNRTNSLYRFALKEKPSLGSKLIRLLPYVSRMTASMNKDSKDWTVEQFNRESDRIMRLCLQHQHEL